jgi:hypothetical protein
MIIMDFWTAPSNNPTSWCARSFHPRGSNEENNWDHGSRAALLSASSVALAFDIGGLNLPVGPTFTAGQIYENNLIGVIGQTLSG